MSKLLLAVHNWWLYLLVPANDRYWLDISVFVCVLYTLFTAQYRGIFLGILSKLIKYNLGKRSENIAELYCYIVR